MRRHAVEGVVALVLFGVALSIRFAQHHTALLYPDGYQYLLMARGFSQHLQPTTVLGPGGETFAPNPDAGLKPLYPLLVAGVHTFVGSWLDAARLVTCVAGAAAVAALALLVTKLSGSRIAGLGAGLLLLASPSVGFWSGFSGPDPLAQSLFLASALAFAYRRPRAGGLLAGLAVASRPELLFVAIAAVLISLRHEESRHAVRRAAPVAGAVVMLIFAVTRTPIAVADGRLIWLLPVFLAVAGLVALAPAAVLRYATIAALAGTVLVLFSASGPHEVWHEDWPTILFGAAGVVLLVGNSRRSAVATFAVGLTVLLGGIYLLKNPSVARYFSLLIPLAAIAAGFAVASVPRHVRPVALGAVTLTVLFGFLHPVPGNRDYDMFRMVAGQVGPRLEARSLVTAAPDAYGFWLPGHPVRAMRKGARGAVLLDASQREYEPGLTAHGKVVARIGGDFALSRPNGDIDAAPVLLVAGRVIAEPSTRHGLSSTP